MATWRPCACSPCKATSLSWGVHSPCAWDMPACVATRCTAPRRSPDNICTDTPACCSARTTSAASGRTSSITSNRASSVNWPSLPCPESTTCSASPPSCVGTPAWRAEPKRSQRGAALPDASCTSAVNPWPASSRRLNALQRVLSAGAAATMARDAGCMDCRASVAARARASSRSSPGAHRTECTAMPSRVSVPVLSNTSASTLARASSPCRLRTSTPWRASVPAAVNMATGVAKDKAHGQVTISTATATISAWPGSEGHHQTTASPAASNTAKRKGRAIRSASWARRGFCNEALSIKARIWAKRV